MKKKEYIISFPGGRFNAYESLEKALKGAARAIDTEFTFGHNFVNFTLTGPAGVIFQHSYNERGCYIDDLRFYNDGKWYFWRGEKLAFYNLDLYRCLNDIIRG